MFIRTQHKAVWNRERGWWQTEDFEPPEGGVVHGAIHFPNDPRSQPIEITWRVGP